jgi:hypothetical protein
VYNEGTSRQPGGDTTRSTDKTSHAEHGCRTATKDDGERLQQRPADLQWGDKNSERTLAPQSLDTDPLNLDTGCRNNARLQSAMRAKPDNFARLSLEGTRNSERRINVSARATSHN